MLVTTTKNAFRRLCEQRLAGLDPDQRRLHERLAAVGARLDALLAAVARAECEDWTRFHPDGNAERCPGDEVRQLLRRLRRRCEDPQSSLNNICSGALYALLDRMGARSPIALEDGEADARPSGRVRQLDPEALPAPARDLFAATAWAHVLDGIDMLAANLDQALELSAAVYAGVCPAEDWTPADLLGMVRALACTLDVYRSALSGDAPPAVTRRIGVPCVESLAAYLSPELLALGVNAWEEAGQEDLDASATLVRPVVLPDDGPEPLYVSRAAGG